MRVQGLWGVRLQGLGLEGRRFQGVKALGYHDEGLGLHGFTLNPETQQKPVRGVRVSVFGCRNPFRLRGCTMHFEQGKPHLKAYY